MSIDEQKKFCQEALNKHNECRKKHGVPDLSLNSELNNIALSWAQNIASRDVLEHSSRQSSLGILGENILAAWSSGVDVYNGGDATMVWYNEVENYNFSNQGFFENTAHFTQVVWKNSQQVGFGIAKSQSGTFYAVANYYPPGNVIGEFEKNVFPPNSNPSPDPNPPSPTPEPTPEPKPVDDDSYFIHNRFGYLDGDLNHIWSSRIEIKQNQDLIKWKLKSYQGNFLLQCVGTGHYLDGGGGPLHIWPYTPERYPNLNYLLWKTVDFNDGFLLQCVGSGQYLSAGPYHIWPYGNKDVPNQEYITWKKTKS